MIHEQHQLDKQMKNTHARVNHSKVSTLPIIIIPNLWFSITLLQRHRGRYKVRHSPFQNPISMKALNNSQISRMMNPKGKMKKYNNGVGKKPFADSRLESFKSATIIDHYRNGNSINIYLCYAIY